MHTSSSVPLPSPPRTLAPSPPAGLPPTCSKTPAAAWLRPWRTPAHLPQHRARRHPLPLRVLRTVHDGRSLLEDVPVHAAPGVPGSIVEVPLLRPTTPPPYRRFHHRDTPAYVLGPPSPSVSSSSEEITDGAPARPSLTVSRQRRRSVPSSSPHPYTFTPVPFCLDRRARYSGRSVGAGFVGPEDPYLAVGTLRHPQCRCRE
ncbi:hypothetical protein ColKHC_04932 [Colletotrichum higginsianum]|nr:hypothetical protein ColKHC_04932 [Colletotrichum higginsianum]